MNRKHFIQKTSLATAAVLLADAAMALGSKTKAASRFTAIANPNRFKIAATGTRFFETELRLPAAKAKLSRKYFIAEENAAYGAPALLENGQDETLLFIPELYDGSKHNGFIVKLCAGGLCEETKIFTHGNQGFYAFWGKPYLGQPTLYHYNAATMHLMRAHRENGFWVNHRVMPLYPAEMVALYTQQQKQVTGADLPQQFGYDFEIHKDGFYEFLTLKNGWEQSTLIKEQEAYELANPAIVYTDANFTPAGANMYDDAELTPTNPFKAIYCEGDDTSHAITKPTIFYKEVPGSKIEIPNMPAYRTQDDFGECRAFSLAVLMQKYTCDKWKNDIADCQNPPPKLDISYFGMQMYTNRNLTQDKSYQPNQDNARNMYEIMNVISNNPSFILNSCKPFGNMVEKFSTKGQQGLADRDLFFDYLKKVYDTNKSTSIETAPGCEECLEEIERFTGMDKKYFNLKKALSKDSFDRFMYVMFFDGCKLESFADGFHTVAYPNDATNATTGDVKNKILEGLKKGKPVLFPSICLGVGKGHICVESHSAVISGYKKVYTSSEYKEVFKLHNSWGIEWQKKYNDGWIDADLLMFSTIRLPNQSESSRVQSGAVIWLEP